jgi:PAS domain S-box-containing protein
MKKTKILVVEDEAITAHAIQDALSKLKYTVVGIEKSGELALEMAEKLKPDLILMDIILSGTMDGIEASKIIKDKLNIPIVYVTANADIETVIQARNSQPYGYIIKPIKNHELFSTIDTALQRFKLEQQLKDSESRLAKAQEIAHLGNWDWDIKSGTFTWSAEMYRIYGVHPDEFDGSAKAVLKTLHPDDRRKHENAFALAKKGEKVIPFEFRIVHPDGSEHNIEITVEANYDDSGRLTSMFGTALDITERKLADEEIRRINRLYNVLSKINLTLVQMNAHQNLFHEICKIAVEIGGFTLAWIGWHDAHSHAVIPIASAGEAQQYIKKISIYSDDRPEGRGATGTAIREKRTYVCNDIFADPNMLPWQEAATKTGIRSSAAFPFFLKEQVYGALNLYSGEKNFFNEKEIELLEEMALNLSFGLNNMEEEAERLRAEEALRESEEQYRLLIQNISDVVFSFDLDLKLLSVSPSVEKILGYKPEELIGRKIQELAILAPESLVTSVQKINRVLTDKTNILFELVFITKDETRKIGELNTSPLIRDGKVVALISVARDITDRKLTEQALNEERMFTETVIHSLPGVFHVLEPDGRYVRWNRHLEELTGISAEKLLTTNALSIMHEEDRELIAGKIREVFEKGEAQAEARLLIKDGTSRHFLFTGKRLVVGKNEFLVGAGVDINDRKQGEDFIKNSLQEKEILLREIHHRVKNNMQLIISLLSLQARNIKDENMKLLYKDAEYRIRVMSLIHEKLYLSENLARVDFPEYIRSIFNQIRSIYNINSNEISLELNADHVELGVDLAVPSGLIVNEILTNSFKHAFPSNFTDPGKITVSLRESQYNIIELIISDNGIGAHHKMDLNKQDSLGMLLISILTKQINGTVTVDNHAGTSFTIIFRNEI